MSRSVRAAGLGAALLSVQLGSAAPAWAQAFTPPRGVGAVTFGWQYIHNLGHRFSDGSYIPGSESTTTSLLLDVEYAPTERLALTASIPYVFARYEGSQPPFTPTPADLCRCWQSSFADFGASVRYRFGGETWAVTPLVRVGQPSHDYPYRGEAVVGKALSEVQLGVFTGLRLVELLPRASLQLGYTYAFVERPLDDVPIDRSNFYFDLGYAVNRRLYVRGGAMWVHTHGGLRIGSPTGDPFPFPGEFNTPARRVESDRVLHVEDLQLTTGLSANLGPLDVYAYYGDSVWGRDAHNGRIFGLGATWYFGLPN